jgi:hypothetical protein
MRFRFLSLPTGKRIELVWKLHWHTVVARVYRLYKDTLTTSINSGAPLRRQALEYRPQDRRTKGHPDHVRQLRSSAAERALECRPQDRRTSREEDGRHRSLTRMRRGCHD